MDFTSHGKGLTVWLENARTVYHGPGQAENVPGEFIKFERGLLSLPEKTTKDLERIKKFLAHDCWQSHRISHQPKSETITLPDGRRATVQGLTLEEELAMIEARINGTAPPVIAAKSPVVEITKPAGDVPEQPLQPQIREGNVGTSQMSGPPKSKFVK